MFDLPPGRCGIVAHDAGAANQILHWIVAGDLSDIDIALSLHGPAKVIADRLGLLSAMANIEDPEALIQNVDWIISGTGWATEIEKYAMSSARQRGIPVLAVLDHWVNYRPRFNYLADGLPDVDELWVVDEEAQVLAAAEFPGSTVRTMPGRYLQAQVEDISLPETSGKVLFLMEPVREQWGAAQPDKTVSCKSGEFLAFDFFLGALQTSGVEVSEIVIRPHPSDPPGKYDFLANAGDSNIKVRADDSLAQAISVATFVVGLNSYAMVVALAAGRKVYCALPPEAPACVLPHAGITDLRQESFGV